MFALQLQSPGLFRLGLILFTTTVVVLSLTRPAVQSPPPINCAFYREASCSSMFRMTKYLPGVCQLEAGRYDSVSDLGTAPATYQMIYGCNTSSCSQCAATKAVLKPSGCVGVGASAYAQCAPDIRSATDQLVPFQRFYNASQLAMICPVCTLESGMAFDGAPPFRYCCSSGSGHINGDYVWCDSSNSIAAANCGLNPKYVNLLCSMPATTCSKIVNSTWCCSSGSPTAGRDGYECGCGSLNPCFSCPGK